jgi:Predicted hydrolases or acyltransferases (alpha/beta hydrolase superfamily)
MPPLTFDQAHHLDVDGGRIAYYETGTGHHSVVWVHGLPLDSRSWAAQQEFFDPHARNVFIDLRGYGASDKLPPDAGSVTALYTADLAALIAHLRLENPTVVGFASAGHVALRFAAQHPGCWASWPSSTAPPSSVAATTGRTASTTSASPTSPMPPVTTESRDSPTQSSTRAWSSPISALTVPRSSARGSAT